MVFVERIFVRLEAKIFRWIVFPLVTTVWQLISGAKVPRIKVLLRYDVATFIDLFLRSLQEAKFSAFITLLKLCISTLYLVGLSEPIKYFVAFERKRFGLVDVQIDYFGMGRTSGTITVIWFADRCFVIVRILIQEVQVDVILTISG